MVEEIFIIVDDLLVVVFFFWVMLDVWIVVVIYFDGFVFRINDFFLLLIVLYEMKDMGLFVYFGVFSFCFLFFFIDFEVV